MFWNNPQAQGPASAEILVKLRPVRYCVIVLWVSFVVKSAFTSPLAHLSDLFLASAGTYLLMNDEKLAPCYTLFLQTPLAFCGGGGLRCAVPFVFMGAIDGIFGIFQFVSLLTTGFWTSGFIGTLYFVAVGAATFSSGYGAYIVYQALKDIISARPQENSFSVHPPQYVSLAPNTRPSSSSIFPGSAQRLGDV